MKFRLNYNLADLLFRILFSWIFIALGLEHLFSDELIQTMIPDWIGGKRLISLGAGGVLLGGGLALLAGYRVRMAGALLGGFLILVTVTVHGPALLHVPTELPEDWRWLWEVYQRSNFFKNLCLVGVCIYLTHHRVGRFGFDGRRTKDEDN